MAQHGRPRPTPVVSLLNAPCPLWVLNGHTAMSAPCLLYPKSGHRWGDWDVRFVPEADISSLFDQLVGCDEKRDRKQCGSILAVLRPLRVCGAANINKTCSSKSFRPLASHLCCPIKSFCRTVAVKSLSQVWENLKWRVPSRLRSEIGEARRYRCWELPDCHCHSRAERLHQPVERR